jgi:hypothetical protein
MKWLHTTNAKHWTNCEKSLGKKSLLISKFLVHSKLVQEFYIRFAEASQLEERKGFLSY